MDLSRPLYTNFRIAADEFYKENGRYPFIRELISEAGMGSLASASHFLNLWREEKGLRKPLLSDNYLPAAEEFLKVHNRAPTSRELLEIVDQGSAWSAKKFLNKWRSKKGLSMPKWAKRFPEPCRPDIRTVIEKLSQELGRMPKVVEVHRLVYACRSTVSNHMKKWRKEHGVV
ncbi:MAG: hypothetical protein LBR22_05525 [Desulfovibrio sp.]|jgi:uncharacterized protein YhaN|nr:hypothetical protein [Desulfovibrio sp.]